MSENVEHIITISIKEIRNIKPIFTSSSIKVNVEFINECLYENAKLSVEKVIKIDEDIEITISSENLYTIDNLINNPLVLRLNEVENLDEMYIEKEQATGKAIWMSALNVLELEYALLGTKTDLGLSELSLRSRTSSIKAGNSSSKSMRIMEMRKSKERSLKGSKTSKMKSNLSFINGEQEIGLAFLELMPLFLGEAEFEVMLKLKSNLRNFDDRMQSQANLPQILMKVSINQPLPIGRIYKFTVESIYNLPTHLNSTYSYQLAVHLPSHTVHVNNYEYQDVQLGIYQFKKWPDVNYHTNILVADNFDDVLNGTDAFYDYPRIEYNVLHRVFANLTQMDALKTYIKKERYLAIELYITKHSKDALDAKLIKRVSKEKAGRSKSKSNSLIDSLKLDDTSYHLMAFIDLCKALHPGEQCVRIRCPFVTFNREEMEWKVGKRVSFCQEVSDVLPTLVVDLPPPKETESSKSSKSGKEAIKGNYFANLPTAPTPASKSQPFENELGAQMFVIIEFQFDEPLEPINQLENVILDEPEEEHLRNRVITTTPTFAKSKNATKKEFQETIKKLYKHLKAINKGKCESTRNEYIFLEYLRTQGYYQHFLSQLTESAVNYISAASIQPELSVMYTELVELTNKTLDNKRTPPINNLIQFAYEAMELEARNLANRYLLQCICNNAKSSEYWLHYAIFNLHFGEKERAFECALKACQLDECDKKAFLLYGMLLARKKRFNEAETILLNVTLLNPDWMQGWGALYCIYMLRNNMDGMEVAYEYGVHLMRTHTSDLLTDVCWCDREIPKTFFYRITAFFISLRLLDEAEMMLSNEMNNGCVQYLLAVIAYYRKDYPHALQHIDEAIVLGGADYVKYTFKGNVYATLGDVECALGMYKKIEEFFNQPTDALFFYFPHIQSGLCLSKLGDDQLARITFLKACKLKGSAYTWLCAGVLFYHQHDYQCAEECLTYSNYLDCNMAETWTYLSLVHLKLNKLHEALICYHQVRSLLLENSYLMDMLESEFNCNFDAQ